FTRSGLMTPDARPIAPGSDPTPEAYPFEQWEAIANQYTKTIDTHMPSSRVALASKFANDVRTLGLNAGQSINRVTRNPLFRAYLAGNTNVILLGVIGAFSLRVASLAGFRRVLRADG